MGILEILAPLYTPILRWAGYSSQKGPEVLEIPAQSSGGLEASLQRQGDTYHPPKIIVGQPLFERNPRPALPRAISLQPALVDFNTGDVRPVRGSRDYSGREEVGLGDHIRPMREAEYTAAELRAEDKFEVPPVESLTSWRKATSGETRTQDQRAQYKPMSNLEIENSLFRETPPLEYSGGHRVEGQDDLAANYRKIREQTLAEPVGLRAVREDERQQVTDLSPAKGLDRITREDLNPLSVLEPGVRQLREYTPTPLFEVGESREREAAIVLHHLHYTQEAMTSNTFKLVIPS